MLKIGGNRVYIQEKFQPATLIIDGEKIKAVESGNNSPDIDYGDNRILPGLVDIHNHGGNGMSCGNATAEGAREWVLSLAQEGCTSCLASTSTGPVENIFKSFDVFNEIMKEKPVGAQVLGIYVEGPHISFSKAGAQDKYEIRKPSADEIKSWQERAQGSIRLCAVAPEMDYGHEMIKYCAANGIRVAIGHTAADYDETLAAIRDGATDFTHTFNAMTQLGHRSPGVVGAAMISDQTYTELIADGIHVHPAAANVLARCKGKDKLIFVTDSVQLKGMKPGQYKSGSTTIVIGEDGSIRQLDGTLSGSANRVNRILANAITVIGIDEVTAINAATKNPCEMLGIDNKGVLAPGMDADITVLNDSFDVLQTYCLGTACVKNG